MSLLCNCCYSRKELYLFDKVEALFLYQDELRSLLIKFKLYSCLQLGELWASLIYNKARTYLNMGYVIVPTPSNRKHSSFTAINYYLNKQTVQINYCLYKKRGVAQKNLTGNERLVAIKGRIYSKGVVPTKVLLVDDIFTTGATLSECTKILRERGAQEVVAIVIAIAPIG